MNLQGRGMTPQPAKPVSHTPPGGSGGNHKKHTPVSHNHIKHPATRQHRPATHKRSNHKSTAPRNALPVTELVQAMQWFVAPAAC